MIYKKRFVGNRSLDIKTARHEVMKDINRSFLIVLLTALLFPTLTCADDKLIGIATVIDGDTIEIHGARVRLYGIDAPESSQLCTKAGQPWRCGRAAALALSDFIGTSVVHCEANGHDRYHRTVATCGKGASEINLWLVSEGWALDWARYSKGAYAAAQETSRAGKKGIWASEFQEPWEWRNARRKP